MENRIEFESIIVSLDQLYLDPNNLRFTTADGKKVSFDRVKEDGVQKATLDKLKNDEFQIKALRDSIIEVGFLPIDRIVVSKIDDESYLVIEGNRRVGALKWIEELINEGITPKAVRETYEKLPINVLLPQYDTESNRLKIQGIRHISEIRPWGTYQKALLIKSMIENEHLTSQDVANAIGYRTQEVNRIYRAFRLLEQMQEDPDYGDYAKPDLISFFYEAVGRNPLKIYFGYNQETYEFEKEETYKLFYKWIIKDPENGNSQKIPSANNVRDITKIVENSDALSAFKEDSTSLEGALAVAIKYASVDWRKEVNQATEAIKKLPIDELENFSTDDIQILSSLRDMIEKRINLYDKTRGLK